MGQVDDASAGLAGSGLTEGGNPRGDLPEGDGGAGTGLTEVGNLRGDLPEGDNGAPQANDTVVWPLAKRGSWGESTRGGTIWRCPEELVPPRKQILFN